VPTWVFEMDIRKDDNKHLEKNRGIISVQGYSIHPCTSSIAADLA